ncbi:hypothetical protein Psta_0901 [Pirellula staleyi DSM 6068]|uniref:Transmembrane protein n=1 Tax=Pirellula staleyi (strain ATCC 27377 / DSM 6068 / ICPB 4128) TaxID=530564 RepID=D2R790_PIRSD|nr:hypothetical protein [Pirellula staleyi]ADB15586.1 hypothetical protein Psta_0901 [Pirellula staleyi DSM 6068]
MQLDNTRIAVRQRTLLETLDLALVVIREFFHPWLSTTLMMVVPLWIINYLLIGWMANEDLENGDFPFRFTWNMLLLIYLEAPLASIFTVAFFGPAVFMQNPKLKQVARDLLKVSPALLFCHGFLRGVLPAWGLLLLVDEYEASPVEFFFLPMICLWSTGMRIARPFISEIILLEKNPLRAKRPGQISINMRSADLHGPSFGDLFVQWMASVLVGVFLYALFAFSLSILAHFLLSDSDLNWWKLQFLYPGVGWLVVGYFSIVRFLNYVDLRIRHEGWEVDLLMRAEAIRLSGRML